MVAILNPLAALSVRMTVDEYLQADLPEGYRYELVDGEIQVTPAPGGQHDTVMDRLGEMLYAYKRRHPRRIQHISFRSGLPIPGKETVREPDVAVYARWTPKPADGSVWKKNTPILVIEVVSIGGEHRDYHQKREEYARSKIEEYWIVDPGAADITVLTRARRPWQERVYGPGKSFACQCLPGLQVSVDQVLGLNGH